MLYIRNNLHAFIQLRANGIHARYATITGEMTIERFMNWMGGFTNATAALDFAATGGMPVTGLREGGQIKHVSFEQVVVLGWVDMAERGRFYFLSSVAVVLQRDAVPYVAMQDAKLYINTASIRRAADAALRTGLNRS